MNREEIKVILVDENDIQTGMAGKLEAHEQGLLHRAVSVFIVNSRGDWILQRRALDKYHSNGLWTNTCCTHPQKGESVFDAAKRRLMEEMGFSVSLTEIFRFIYSARYDQTWGENEYDVVFRGKYSGEVKPDPTEAEDYKWISLDVVKKDIEANPDLYTPWFKIVLKKLK